jgi:hypothetical protein
MSSKKSDAKARAGIIASRRIYAQDRMSDYGLTTDIVGSLFKSLGTTAKGRTAALTGQHARQLAAIEGLRARTSKGGERDIDRAAGFSNRNFGSVATGMAAPLYRQAGAHLEGSRKTMRGLSRGGDVLAAGGQDIMATLTGGVKEAAQAAKYQTAEALQYRAKADAKLIADQQNQIQMAKLEFQYWKKQQDYLKKLEEGDTTGKLGGVTQVTQYAVESGVEMRQLLAENPTASVDDLINAATAGDTGITEQERMVLRQVALAAQRSVGEDGMTKAGFSREDEAEAILDSVLLLYPDYKKVPKLRETILAGLQSGWSAEQAYTWAQAAERFVPMSWPEFQGANPGATKAEYAEYVKSVQAAAAASAARGDTGAPFSLGDSGTYAGMGDPGRSAYAVGTS